MEAGDPGNFSTDRAWMTVFDSWGAVIIAFALIAASKWWTAVELRRADKRATWIVSVRNSNQ